MNLSGTALFRTQILSSRILNKGRSDVYPGGLALHFCNRCLRDVVTEPSQLDFKKCLNYTKKYGLIFE